MTLRDFSMEWLGQPSEEERAWSALADEFFGPAGAPELPVQPPVLVDQVALFGGQCLETNVDGALYGFPTDEAAMSFFRLIDTPDRRVTALGTTVTIHWKEPIR